MSQGGLPGDGELDEPAIGVGMGGSCPECRAPVDLGQEFCLECGSPIRYSAKQRRRARGATGAVPALNAGGAVRSGDRPPNKGFPWIPFLVVLALVIGGAAFALVDGGDDSSKSDPSSPKSTTKSALPSISTGAPTEATAQTTTLQDCDPAQPLGTSGTGSPTEPTSTDGSETIPELTPNDSLGDGATARLSTDGLSPDAGVSGGTSTVDQNGSPCPASGTDTTSPTDTSPTTPTSPTASTATSPTASTSTSPTAPTGSSSSTTWPSGKTGWTVIVFGYGDQSRANQAAADLQAKSIESGVLFSTDFASLCPGIWVVFSGVFDTRAQADARQQELIGKGYAGMYSRKVATTGSASGCR